MHTVRLSDTVADANAKVGQPENGFETFNKSSCQIIKLEIIFSCVIDADNRGNQCAGHQKFWVVNPQDRLLVSMALHILANLLSLQESAF